MSLTGLPKHIHSDRALVAVEIFFLLMTSYVEFDIDKSTGHMTMPDVRFSNLDPVLH
jgi:hypothetical protein